MVHGKLFKFGARHYPARPRAMSVSLKESLFVHQPVHDLAEPDYAIAGGQGANGVGTVENGALDARFKAGEVLGVAGLAARNREHTIRDVRPVHEPKLRVPQVESALKPLGEDVLVRPVSSSEPLSAEEASGLPETLTVHGAEERLGKIVWNPRPPWHSCSFASLSESG
jgi:hypothetical protein